MLCVIDVYRKRAWFFLLKDKNGITTTNAFPKYWHRSGRKPNKIWVDEGSAFYNEVMIPDNGTEIIQHKE